MPTNRDDFPKAIIEKAAARVGYLCSMCKCPTKGASMESNDKVSSIGVAAHICAAAPGGPRYDPAMTPQERAGIDNCLWLCQTDSRVIDTDTVTYTVASLRKMKRDAEIAASQALASGGFFREYFRNNEDNIDVLEKLFDNMIVEGNYMQFQTVLSQYQTGLSSVYDELIYRQQVFYAAYCDRDQLAGKLQQYLDKTDKAHVEKIAELFISMQFIDELKTIVSFISSQSLSYIAELIVSDQFERSLSTKNENNPFFKYSDDAIRVILRKAVLSGIANGKIRLLEDNIVVDDFYFELINAGYQIVKNLHFGTGDLTRQGPDFYFIRDNLHKMQLLDPSLQVYSVYAFLLCFTGSPAEFETEYNNLCEEVKQHKHIRSLWYEQKIRNRCFDFDVDELINFAKQNNLWILIQLYIDFSNEKDAESFLLEHQFLFRLDSTLLPYGLRLYPNEKESFLRKYGEGYIEDFGYHCLLASECANEDERNTEMVWLLNHEHLLSHVYIHVYLQALLINKQWGKMREVAKGVFDNGDAYLVIQYLVKSNDRECIAVALSMTQSLIEKNWSAPVKLRALAGQISQQLCNIEKAKSYFQQEYDLTQDMFSLMQLIRLRYSTHDYTIDQYVADLSKNIDSEAQSIVGAVYLKHNNCEMARTFFLRSLLIQKENNRNSINGLFQALLKDQDDSVPDSIAENTVCCLKNESQTIYIAIHTPRVLSDITPNTFADCLHHSVDDSHISGLLFGTVGELVKYNDQEYIVEAINTLWTFVGKYVFTIITAGEDVIQISSESPEEIFNAVAKISHESAQNAEEKLRIYNALSVRAPLSLFARLFGKNMLTSCEFLMYGNKDFIRNNPGAYQGNIAAPETFILSYDEIVLLAHLHESERSTIAKHHLVCAPQVRHRIIEDIDEELNHLLVKNEMGVLTEIEGQTKIIVQSPEEKRNRHQFLTQMKTFVQAIDVPEMACDFEAEAEGDAELIRALQDQNLFCELGTLGLAQKSPDALLVTDDQFLTVIAVQHRLSTIGLSGLGVLCFDTCNACLSLSKYMHDVHFFQYMPIDLYKKLIDLIIDTQEIPSDELEDILKWLSTDTDDLPSDHHKAILFNLLQEIKNTPGLEYLDEDNIIERLLLSAAEREDPDFWSKVIEVPE